MHPVLTLGIAGAALVACGTRSTEPSIAGLANGGTTAASSSSLTISPNQVTIRVGTTSQRSTKSGASQQGPQPWSSSNTTVATVSGTGLVTAFQPGASTITARLRSDTTQNATATVLVTSP
jgi:uncharacterized protein YjdB